MQLLMKGLCVPTFLSLPLPSLDLLEKRKSEGGRQADGGRKRVRESNSFSLQTACCPLLSFFLFMASGRSNWMQAMTAWCCHRRNGRRPALAVQTACFLFLWLVDALEHPLVGKHCFLCCEAAWPPTDAPNLPPEVEVRPSNIETQGG